MLAHGFLLLSKQSVGRGYDPADPVSMIQGLR